MQSRFIQNPIQPKVEKELTDICSDVTKLNSVGFLSTRDSIISTLYNLLTKDYDRSASFWDPTAQPARTQMEQRHHRACWSARKHAESLGWTVVEGGWLQFNKPGAPKTSDRSFKYYLTFSSSHYLENFELIKRLIDELHKLSLNGSLSFKVLDDFSSGYCHRDSLVMHFSNFRDAEALKGALERTGFRVNERKAKDVQRTDFGVDAGGTSDSYCVAINFANEILADPQKFCSAPASILTRLNALSLDALHRDRDFWQEFNDKASVRSASGSPLLYLIGLDTGQKALVFCSQEIVIRRDRVAVPGSMVFFFNPHDLRSIQAPYVQVSAPSKTFSLVGKTFGRGVMKREKCTRWAWHTPDGHSLNEKNEIELYYTPFLGAQIMFVQPGAVIRPNQIAVSKGKVVSIVPALKVTDGDLAYFRGA